MGSSTPLSLPFLPALDTLPSASADSVVLTHPTAAELEAAWTLSHPSWGAALSLADYYARERFLTAVPLARDGGITHWLLTTAGPVAADAEGEGAQASQPPAPHRPVLASCESLRKRVLVAGAAGGGEGGGGGGGAGGGGGTAVVRVREGVVHGIASVYTDPRLRGRGYAHRMMEEVGRALRTWQRERAAPPEADGKGSAAAGGGGAGVVGSVLYSDIGKEFYARKGWTPFASTHLALPPLPAGEGEGDERAVGGEAKLRELQYHDMPELCRDDEVLLRARLEEMAKAAAAGTEKKTFVAVLPDLDALQWHLMREDYMTQQIFGRTPAVRGALYTGRGAGRRMWAVWTRGYYAGVASPKDNTLYILRFVVEDEGDADGGALAGFRAIVQTARREARDWKTGKVALWSPTPFVRQLAEKSGLEHEFVEREKESIASLMWYGEGSVDEVEWVAIERYAWC